jgi:GDPmannose 4,6-dehydratase
VEAAFEHVGLNWKDYVEVDPRYFRPAEVDHLRGDATKAKRDLGWEPRVRFVDLVRMMVEGDLELARQEKTLRQAGHVPASRGGHE